MPRLYPAVLPPDTPSAAEVAFHRALARQLDDEWVVIHSIPWADTRGGGFREGECDFVVLHPRHGWLAIEAKTGVLEPDPATGGWRCANGTRIQDPVRQALRSLHRLENEIAARCPFWRQGRKLPYGHAVALPHTRRLPERLPAHAPAEVFLLEDDMARLSERLSELLARHAERGGPREALSADEFAAVLDALLPVFRIVPSLAHELDREGEAMHRLTEQQAFFLAAARHAPRLLVIGASGSGKTLLAVEEARRFAADGARVLFLCFNRALSRHLAGTLADTPDLYCPVISRIVSTGYSFRGS